MENENKFKNVLHEDEKIVVATSANKKSYVLKRVLAPLIVFLVVTTILTIVAILNPVHFVNDKYYYKGEWLDGYYAGFPLWVLYLVSGSILAVLLLVLLISCMASKNYYICLTDKRIITRHGAFTTDYTYYAIDKVSGNITINCNQSIFDKSKNSCALYIKVELLPVGHSDLQIWTPSLIEGYDFSKKVDKQIKNNAKLENESKATKE